MKLENKARHAYIAYGEVIGAGEVKEFDDKKQDKIIAVLLKQPKVREFVDVAVNKKMAEENERLKAELAKLKGETETEAKEEQAETETEKVTEVKTAPRAKAKKRGKRK